MDINSNKYTFAFALIMVIVVAAILSTAAIVLKEPQQANIRQEKMQDILKSIGVDVERKDAPAAYEKYIADELIIQGGKVIESEVAAFDINMAEAITHAPNERAVPLYVASLEGTTYYVLPLRGAGLWGPIWGYISLEDDGSTIKGATFGHQGETPGLGAEIATEIFYDQFSGKKIMEAGSFSSIEVRKGDAQGDHQVDGISGGTITSTGVQTMLASCLSAYVDYFKNLEGATASVNTSSK